MATPSPPETAARRFGRLLDAGAQDVMPCCFDALSARLIERADFAATFMSGFAVSAARVARCSGLSGRL